MCDPGGHDTQAETRSFKRRARTVESRTHAVCDSQEKAGGSWRSTRSSLLGCPAGVLRAKKLGTEMVELSVRKKALRT